MPNSKLLTYGIWVEANLRGVFLHLVGSGICWIGRVSHTTAIAQSKKLQSMIVNLELVGILQFNL